MDARQELEDEFNAQYGDPRRCPAHGCVTSSPDGMFDAPCPACEGEMEEDAWEDTPWGEYADLADLGKHESDDDEDLPF